MLKRLYILAFVVTLVWAYRVYRKVSAERVPAQAPSAPATKAPAPRRETASVPQLDQVRPATKSSGSAPSLKTDLAPEALLERKRHGVFKAKGTEDPATSPLARYAEFKRTARQTLGGRKFLILGARAVRAEDYRSDLGPVVFEEGEYRIVADASDRWDRLATANDSIPLMVNPSNGRLAFVTGALQATVTDQAVAERIAGAENLTLVHFEPASGLAYLRAPAGYGLRAGLGRIGTMPGVRAVELELVESRKVAR